MLITPYRLMAPSPLPRPTLEFRFLGATALDTRIAFTRASSGTYFDRAGLLQTAATDVPRFDYSLATIGLPLGLLVESASTNYLLWCRDLTNVAWTKSNVTTATCAGLDGGAATATTITASATNGTALQSITRSSAARISSAYVKRRTGSGTLEMTQNNGTLWTAVTVTAAWTRVALASATAANPIVGFRIGTSGDAIDIDFVQHEEVTLTPTSPIATTTASATRALETALISSLSWYNAVAGTIYVEFSMPYVPASGNQRALSIDDTTTNERIQMHIASAVPSAFVADGNVMQASPSSGTATAGQVQKLALAYAVNDFAFARNAGSVVTDTVGTLPTVTRMTLGYRQATDYLNGHIRSFRYWPYRRGNVRLQNLTA